MVKRWPPKPKLGVRVFPDLLFIPVEHTKHAYSMSKRHHVKMSPLRYPGGKTKAISALKRYIPPETTQICSPFFGGGSFELSCAAEGCTIHGYDVFAPLVDFWQALATNKDELVKEVRRYLPLQKETFHHLQKTLTALPTQTQRAAALFVLNRSSFSGTILSGGMSPGHPRFTSSSIERLANFNVPNIAVQQASFYDSIRLHEESVMLYLDPPYLVKSALYGSNGDIHRNFDHLSLAEMLKNRSNWILSYNDCAEIHELYDGYLIDCPTWKYGMPDSKNSKEIVILSHDIADKISSFAPFLFSTIEASQQIDRMSYQATASTG